MEIKLWYPLYLASNPVFICCWPKSANFWHDAST